MRRVPLRETANITKRYRIQIVGLNLGVVMRAKYNVEPPPGMENPGNNSRWARVDRWNLPCGDIFHVIHHVIHLDRGRDSAEKDPVVSGLTFSEPLTSRPARKEKEGSTMGLIAMA